MSFLSFPSVAHPAVHIVRDTLTVGDVPLTFQDRSVRGLDDAVYEKHAAVWTAVPRGDCIITAGSVLLRHVVGLRKFGYEDAPYGRRDAVAAVVRIDKENGECAHIAAFEHHGAQWWVAGSKHVHMAWRIGHFAADMAVYMADRYKYARKIAAVWETMMSSGRYNTAAFFAALASSGATACAEAILSDSEHIVRYEADEKDTLRFYALADPCSPVATALCTVPAAAYDLFRGCGLPVAAATVDAPVAFGSAADAAAHEAVARRINSEGVVCYGLDAAGNVACMWKEKSYPYVMERVVREAVLHNRTLPQIVQRTQQRLKEMDAATRVYFAEWESTRFPWLLAFAAWLHATGVLPVKDAWSVQSRWLTLQDAFRAASAADAAAATATASAALAASGGAAVKVIVLAGLPGSGKSTLARGLFKALQDTGAVPRWLNQDEADSNRARYLGAVKRAAADPATTHIILDKANLDPANRKDYVDAGLAADLTVFLDHPDGLEACKAVCAERFLARGAAHRSLRAAGTGAVDRSKFLSICDAMFRAAKGLEEALHLDVRESPAVNLARVLGALGVCSAATAARAAVGGAGTATAGAAATSGTAAPDALVDRAIEFARRYEEVLPRFARPQYGGIAVAASEAAAVLAAIPAEASADKTPRDAFHVTLRYLGDEMDPVWFMDFAERLGSTVSLVVTEIVWNDKGVAARVELPADLACTNAIPHITLALSHGVKPTYSNDLLAPHRGDAKRVAVRIPVVGTVVFG
jgi:hypothetical protein